MVYQEDIKYFNISIDTYLKSKLNDNVYMFGLTVLVNPEDYKGDKDQAWASSLKLPYFFQKSLNNLITFDFIYIVVEEHKGKEKSVNSKGVQNVVETRITKTLLGYPHFHMLLGIRNLGCTISQMELLLRKFLTDEYLEYGDLAIRHLSGFYNTKKWFNYICKEKQYNRHTLIRQNIDFNTSYTSGLEYFEDSGREPFGDIKHLFIRNSSCSVSRSLLIKELEGEEILLNVLSLYCRLNNLRTAKGLVYKKISDSKYSGELVGTIENVFFLNIDRVFQVVLEKYGDYFNKQLVLRARTLFLDKIMKKLRSDSNLLGFEVIITHSILEFKDGLYFIEKNCLVRWDRYNYELNWYMFDNNYWCRNYYPMYCRQLNKPKLWLTFLYETLENSEEELEKFVLLFAYLFHSKRFIVEEMNEKQSTMLIVGESNTGKSQLASKLLSDFYGVDNIGIVSRGGQFVLEQASESSVIIFDDFDFTKGMRGMLLKMFQGLPVNVNRKYKSDKIMAIKGQSIILANTKEPIFNDKAFANRIKTFKFLKVIENTGDKKLLKQLENEIPKIVIYCNKKLFKHFGNSNNRNFLKQLQQDYTTIRTKTLLPPI